MKLAALLLAYSAVSLAQNYTARTASQQGISVIRLDDAAKGVEVSIVPSLGNRVPERVPCCTSWQLLIVLQPVPYTAPTPT